MEIGHNVMHGQWDWMNDPQINSSTWDWDSASTAEAWKHSHNYVHHTYTNIRGKDRDLGYEIMRIDPHQKWHPVYLFQPFYNLLLAAFFEWGVAMHDLDFEAIRKGEKSKEAGQARAQGHGAQGPPADRQGLRRVPGAERARRARPPDLQDARWPRTSPPTSSATSGPTRSSSAATSPTRRTPSAEEEVADETRGGLYVRQLLGAANIEGSPLFHVLSGNLGYQVEHHLFPDMPSTRYAEIAPRVKDICERYELPYNTGPFRKQLGTRAAHDPAAGLPGRQAAAQARALPRRRRRRPRRSGRAAGPPAPRAGRAARRRAPSSRRTASGWPCRRAASARRGAGRPASGRCVSSSRWASVSQQGPADGRVLEHEGLEVPRRHAQAAQVGVGGDRGRARRAHEEGHLAEVVARAEHAHDVAADAHRGLVPRG